jgi:hypothetical protein
MHLLQIGVHLGLQLSQVRECLVIQREVYAVRLLLRGGDVWPLLWMLSIRLLR